MKWLFLFFACLLISDNAFSATLIVGKDQAYLSIKSALMNAHAGDTVIVHSGLYQEGNLLIDKTISLIGIDMPVLDGEKKYEVISVKADSVLIKGFRIIGSGHSSLEDMGGIKVYDSHYVHIISNTLDDNFFGIYLQYSHHCLVESNTITAHVKEQQLSGNGIHCWKSDSLRIIGNHITGHRDGIYFEFVTASVIWRNISQQNNRYGLHFMFSHNDAYISNLFKDNGAGVAVMFTKHVKMYNNTFEENWGNGAYGLLLKEISDSEVFNNKFVANTTGVFMEGTNRIHFEKNIFRHNGWGLKIQASCMDNTFSVNNFQRNTFDVSTNGTLVLNTFNRNYWDKYEGYDINKDLIGDIPYRPLSIFSVIAERMPAVMILYRSFIVTLLDRAEKIIPTMTPESFADDEPLMHAHPL